MELNRTIYYDNNKGGMLISVTFCSITKRWCNYILFQTKKQKKDVAISSVGYL